MASSRVVSRGPGFVSLPQESQRPADGPLGESGCPPGLAFVHPSLRGRNSATSSWVKGRKMELGGPGPDGGQEPSRAPLEVRISVVPAGGSSSSLRRALAASELDSLGARASASAMMKTWRGPMEGRLWAFFLRLLAAAR